MQLDWFTVAAQIVNFLILVYLLKRLLYRPIIDAMDRREAKIAAQLQEAEEKTRQAESVIQYFQGRIKAFQAASKRLTAQILEETDKRRSIWLDEARAEVDKTRRAWRRDVEREKHQFIEDLRRQLAKGVCSVSREVLAGLANAELERQIIEAFVHKLKSLPAKEQQRFAEGCLEQGAEVLVSSAFQVEEYEQERISKVVKALVGRDVPVQFKEQSSLVCGIALQTATARVEWSVSSYCDQLNERLSLMKVDGQYKAGRRARSTAA